jgi:hypothetical protein
MPTSGDFPVSLFLALIVFRNLSFPIARNIVKLVIENPSMLGKMFNGVLGHTSEDHCS